MNATAKILRTQNATVAMDQILDVHGVSLERALDVDPKLLEPDYLFEWSEIYQLDAGGYDFVVPSGPDPSMEAVLLPVTEASNRAVQATLAETTLLFSAGRTASSGSIADGDELPVGHAEVCCRWRHQRAGSACNSSGLAPTLFLLSTTRMSSARLAVVRGPDGDLVPVHTHGYKLDHEHDHEHHQGGEAGRNDRCASPAA